MAARAVKQLSALSAVPLYRGAVQSARNFTATASVLGGEASCRSQRTKFFDNTTELYQR